MFSTSLNTREKSFSLKFDKYLLKKNSFINSVSSEVELIISNIREKGDSAIISYNNKFDNRNISHTSELLFTKDVIKKSAEKVDKEVLNAMQFAFNRIIEYHSESLSTSKKNLQNSQIFSVSRPLDKVAIYVPGGKASYPSSVLMAAGPAKATGVNDIYLTSPCPNNKINNLVLAAASIAGIQKVYSLGGVQAIAAFGLGTDTFPKVQKIVGPGNQYVNEAKRQLYGEVGIDMLAGPSEIVILADKYSNPLTVAIDLMAQAEHDELASSILISLDKPFIDKVKKILKKEISNLSRQEIIEKSLSNQGAVIKVRDALEAIKIIDLIAPEHLHLVNLDAKEIANSVSFAGMISIGEDSANGLSDYVLGPSHILPTGGTSRFSSPLSSEDFMVKSTFIELGNSQNKSFYNELIKNASILAEAEGLSAHSLSLLKRRK